MMISPIFLAHGSPLLAIQDTNYTRFLRELGNSMKPKAIVVFTAHWESEVVTLSSHDDVYDTIYDFYGFPDELYQVKYPAKGNSSLAEEIRSLLGQAGIESQVDRTRGLDHGSWTLLNHLYPEANIPVVQISVNPFLEPKKQLEIGKALRELTERDILIVGSGVTVHNLRIVNWDQEEPDSWAIEFDDWLLKGLENGDLDLLTDYWSKAPHASMAVPRPEHFVPFFIALGAGSAISAEVLYRGYEFGNLSYMCLKF